MGIRIDIQKKLIALFKVNEYEIVDYDTEGVPSLTGEKETPGVECNETSCVVVSVNQPEPGYTFKNWAFELLCDFKHEVDFSDFVLGLGNLSYPYNDDIMVKVTMDGNIGVKHPPRNISHQGTQLTFNFNIELKK